MTTLRIDWVNRSVFLQESPSQAKPRLAFQVTLNGVIFRGLDMAFLIPDDKTAQVLVTPKDAKGFDAPVEDISYASSDESIVTVDQLGLITPVGLGVAQINVTADALIGEGTVVLAGLLEVEVVAGQAVGLSVGATIG